MKIIKFYGLATIVLVAHSQPALAGPRGGGGGFAGGGQFGGAHFSAPSGGGVRAAPVFSGGATYYTGRSTGGINGAPRYYYRGGGVSALPGHAFPGSSSRSTSRYVRSNSTTNPQHNSAGSVAARTRVSDPRNTSAQTRQRLNTSHSLERHDASWHGDWDRHHRHFHNGHVFVFVNGFWYGFFPWDYPVYNGDDYSYPYDYSGYPDNYSDYYPYNNDDQSAYAGSDQYGNNATVSAVQSALAKLGYYRGAIDGVDGDETQAALARYQEDHDLSVTGTLTAATLQSLGLRQKAS